MMKKDQNGQALLFVIVVMTVALALGVNVSLRTLSSVSRTTRTDTSERVRAAAEAGAERFLILSVNDLDHLEQKFVAGTVTETDCKLAGVDFQISDGMCRIQFPRAEGDQVDVVSYVKVESYNGNWTTDTYLYEFTLEKDNVAEVNVNGLSSTSVRLCFTPQGTFSDIYYVIYGINTSTNMGEIKAKDGIKGNYPGGTYERNAFTDGGTGGNLYGYSYCNDVNIPAGSYGMRIRSIAADSKIAVAHENLPKQGHRIISMGELIQEGAVKVTKEVKASKSLPYLPGVFDFGIFSGTGAL
jgi:hypothetical protein